MNCKQGEMAVIVSCRMRPEIVGTPVVCIAMYQGPEGVCWTVSPPIGNWRGIHDKCLRPIRPGDLEDETPTVRELEAA